MVTRILVCLSLTIVCYCIFSLPCEAAVDKKQIKVQRVRDAQAASSLNQAQNNSAPWVTPSWKISRPQQRLNAEDRKFLVSLGQNVKNSSLTEKIDLIIDRLNISPKLEQEDYDFLTNLSQHLSNRKIAGSLMEIAEKHRP